MEKGKFGGLVKIAVIYGGISSVILGLMMGLPGVVIGVGAGITASLAFWLLF